MYLNLTSRHLLVNIHMNWKIFEHLNAKSIIPIPIFFSSNWGSIQYKIKLYGYFFFLILIYWPTHPSAKIMIYFRRGHWKYFRLMYIENLLIFSNEGRRCFQALSFFILNRCVCVCFVVLTMKTEIDTNASNDCGLECTV